MPLCDSCNKELSEDEGYLLTTAQITSSVASWKNFLVKSSENMPDLLNDSNMLSRMVFARGSSDSPWQICEECAAMFDFDRQQAHANLLHFRETGEPSGGFAVCQLSYQGRDLVADPIDKEAWDVLIEAVHTAIDEIRQDVIQSSDQGEV
ncbi:MAG: hypothetical protein JW908_02445 [Anaerolineales bacterium]|nr:hypothetical protein [Anaerolineales bacterium]